MKRITKGLEGVAAVALLATLVACSGGPEAPVDDPAGGQASAAGGGGGARTLAIPGQELPEGHPPTGATGQGAMTVVWDVPEGWATETPASSMRIAQYRVPGPGGDGECVVFFFGVGQGGDPMANAVRWAGQFTQPDGRASQDVMQMEQLQAGEIQMLVVELTGTYVNLMVNDEEMPGHMLLGAIAPGPDANWFFKFTGPKATVESERAAFEAMLRSLRSGG